MIGDALLAGKIAVARGAGTLSRRIGRGGGTTLPGKVLMKLDRNAIGAIAARLPAGSVAISATNGKTTMAAMAAAVLEREGMALVHNRAGANMAGGIASTLVDAARGRGIDGELGLFEIDEFWLAGLVATLRPRALLLGNLFRDQLDRYGELASIADRWAALVAAEGPTTELLLNADDPLIAGLGDGQPTATYFGIADPAVAGGDLPDAADSTRCRRCDRPLTYDAVYYGHLGRYHCPACGVRRPEPTVAAEAVVLDGMRGSRFTLRTPEGTAAVELPLPGLYNVSNAVGAAALCRTLGIAVEQIAVGLTTVAAAFGRAEQVTVAGREMALLLIKNPAGANEVLRTVALEQPPIDLFAILNDKIADGRDVSWIWDADVELVADQLGTVTCAGSRAAELALRFKYAGVATERIAVIPDLERALDHACAGGTGPLYALPTYTALLELKELLARRGLSREYWS